MGPFVATNLLRSRSAGQLVWGNRWVPGLLLLSSFLAGCAGTTDDGLPAAGLGSDSAAAPDADNLTSLPELLPPMDLWGGLDAKTLFDGTVDVKECYGPTNQVFITFWQAVEYHDVMFGCADYDLPEGTLVPEGTKRLRVEADASGAQHVGMWYPWVTTYGIVQYGDGWYDGEGTTDAKHAWTINLKPKDWDLSHHTKSGFSFGYWTYGGTVNVLYGPVKTKITAERDPEWKPMPVLDEWKALNRHAFVQEDAILLLNATVPWEEPSFPTYMTSNSDSPSVPSFTDVIPYGTKQVAVGLRWNDIEGCLQGHTCSFRAGVNSGGQWSGINEAAVQERGANHLVLVYDVPARVGEDGPYVTNSTTSVGAWIVPCLTADPSRCDPVTLSDTQTKLFAWAEAWKAPVDLQAFKARFGLP